MTKTEINDLIITEFDEEIEKRGLTGKLEIDPICNTFKRRNHFTRKADGTCVFTAFMWDINTLEPNLRHVEIKKRIDAAVAFFKL